MIKCKFYVCLSPFPPISITNIQHHTQHSFPDFFRVIPPSKFLKTRSTLFLHLMQNYIPFAFMLAKVLLHSWTLDSGHIFKYFFKKWTMASSQVYMYYKLNMPKRKQKETPVLHLSKRHDNWIYEIFILFYKITRKRTLYLKANQLFTIYL